MIAAPVCSRKIDPRWFPPRSVPPRCWRSLPHKVLADASLNLVASVAKTCTDEQLVHKWRDIENHLIDVQVHYTDGSEPTLEETLGNQSRGGH